MVCYHLISEQAVIRNLGCRSDNDQYSHVNNSVYHLLYDSIINAYLIKHCGLDPTSSSTIGLVVSSYGQFFQPVSFPQVLELGLRVNHIGNSSVTYEVGVFEEEKDEVCAVGGFTHVFVGSQSRRPAVLEEKLLEGLKAILVLDKETTKL